MPKYFYFFVLTLAVAVVGCSTVALKPADFSWPVEVVVKPDSKGMVQEARYQVAFNVKPLLFEEFQDSVNIAKPLRLIRDYRGYYFITGNDFKHVYVFEQDDASLTLAKKIKVTEKGLQSPAFNQKNQFIELISTANAGEPPILLTKDGIQEGGK